LDQLLCSNHATLPSPRPRVGAVYFLHRFGSGLNRHAHLHAAFIFLAPAGAVRQKRAKNLSGTHIAPDLKTLANISRVDLLYRMAWAQGCCRHC
jgi:hypothetical protein